MKYELNILNKEICQLLLFMFFINVFLTKTDPRVSLCDIHTRKFNHSVYSFFRKRRI